MSTVHRYAYGRHPSQFARLHLPDDGVGLAVAVVIHGGFWRQRYGVELAEPLAEDLTRFGVAALAVEYRRVGDRDDEGGWPRTLADVARAIDALATEGQRLADGRLDLDRVGAIGHSAGGQLAVWAAHRRMLRHGTAGSITSATTHVPIRSAVSQAGVLDLVRASELGLGNGAVDTMMDGAGRSVPQRYQHASPLSHVGAGVPVVCVHGDADEDVPVELSSRYVDAAVLAGDPARLVLLPRTGHMDLIDVGHPAWHTSRDSLLQLL